MKILIFFLALFHSALMAEQDPKPSQIKVHRADLCIGESMQFGEKTVKFEKVVTDSRCPKEVTCVWAGEVKILLVFYDKGELIGKKIVTVAGSDISNLYGVDGLIIEDVNVQPYPSIKRDITKDDYSLAIKISEKKNQN